jgi:serine/threonine-protein kinase
MQRALLTMLAAGLVMMPAVAARAQSKEDVARADALFNAAKALTDAGQYADACAKYAESKRLAPGIGVTLYLADCYEHIGRTASAWTEFRSAEGQAREKGDKRADVARDHAQALESKLVRLAIVVAPTVPQSGLQILRDGVPVTPEELGLAVPVDPGDHAVVVSAPGRASRTLTAHVGPENRNATVLIDSLEELPAAIVPLPVPVPPAPPLAAPGVLPNEPPPPVSLDRGKSQRYVGLGIGGAGAVGLVVGSIFGVLAKVKFDQSNSVQCNASTDRCYSPGFPMRKDAEHAATTSNVGFVIGGVLLAAGATVYFTAPKAAPAVGLAVAPAVVAGGGGAILQTTF